MKLKKFVSILTLLSLLAPQVAYPALSAADRAEFTGRNLLADKNPGAENGKANWTVSSGSFSASTSSPLEGGASFTWDASASSQTFTSASVTIPEGWKGQNGVVSCRLQCASGTCTHTMVPYDGSNNIVSTQTITSATTGAPRTTVNFVYPTSGTVALRLTSAADEPSLKIDSCVIGLASDINLSQVNQATEVGTLTWAPTTNCSWLTTSGSFGNFSNDNDCDDNARTATGILSDGSSGLRPAFTMTNAGPGNYVVMVYGKTGLTNSNTGTSSSVNWRLYDGTNQIGQILASDYTAASAILTNTLPSPMVFRFSLTAPTTATYDLQAKCAGTNCGASVDAGVPGLQFVVYRYPTSSELAYRPETTPAFWSGYHDTTCSWARTNTALGDPTADASCALVETQNVNFGTVTGSNDLPKIVFTPKRITSYFVCAHATQFVGATANDTGTLRLTDGTTTVAEASHREYTNGTNTINQTLALCGVYAATSLSSVTLKIQSASSADANTITAGGVARSAVEWTIFDIGQTTNAPVLAQGVYVPQNTAGATTINNWVTKSGNYTATATDETIEFTADATLTLPAAASNLGKKYYVYTSGTGTDVTIDPNASETVCGQTTIQVRGGGDGVVIQSDGTNWKGLNKSCFASHFISMSGSCSGTCTTGEIDGDWATGFTRGSTGQYTVDIVSGVFSVKPVCTAISDGSQTQNNGTVTTTSVPFATSNSSGTLQDAKVWVQCTGPR